MNLKSLFTRIYRPARPGEKLLEIKDLLRPPAGSYDLLVRDAFSYAQGAERLFSRSGFKTFQTRISDAWCPPVFDIRDASPESLYIRERLAGGILLDLGDPIGTMARFAAHGGARAYIHVDLFLYGRRRLSLSDLDAGISHTPSRRAFIENTQILGIRADMLDFIRRLADASVNVTINGIDGFIAPDEAYHEALAREILRVLKPGGIVFAYGSGCIPHLESMISRNEALKAQFDVGVPPFKDPDQKLFAKLP